jgi:hypothetical protein
MPQLDLFTAPLSRATDPTPSHEAAEEIRPKLSRLREAMLTVIAESGSMTAMEAAAACCNRYGGIWLESARKRCHELVKLGLIVECEPRRCLHSGKMATTYKAK